MQIPVSKLLTADPGLPVPNPTNPYWLREPHALSSTQSPSLPPTSDFVVLGSGITAASVVHTLLKKHPTCRVTVLEARTLCSGATGRNGGHLVTYGGLVYSDLVKKVGRAQATQIVNFTFENIERTKELLAEYGGDAEYRDVTRVRGFEDVESFRAAKDSLAEFERDNPRSKGMYRILTKEEAEMNHGVHSVVGAILFAAGALWPYRLVTSIFEALTKQHSTRLSLSTNTAALSITHDPTTTEPTHSYSIKTPRGTIQASQIIHCTNGHSGHLLPKIRGALFSMRGSMTVQDLQQHGVPNRGADTSWSLHHAARYDPATGLTQMGTFYLQQNPDSGLFFFGGERKSAAGALTADDSSEDQTSVSCLQEKLCSLFGLGPGVQSRVLSTWSGIMGFTSDGLPLVGRLDGVGTDRAGEGEWIAAGFNGMGMSMCVLAGERLAKKILGQEDTGRIPESFGVTGKRWERSLKAEISIANMEAVFPSNAAFNMGREMVMGKPKL